MADRDTILIPLPGEPVRSRPPKSVLAAAMDDVADAWNRHGLPAFVGPHLAQGVRNLGQLGLGAVELLSPGADVREMKDSAGRLSRSVREGNALGAATGGLDLLGSTIAMAWPSTFAGYKRGVGTLVDAAEDMVPRGGLLGAFEGRGGVAYPLETRYNIGSSNGGPPSAPGSTGNGGSGGGDPLGPPAAAPFADPEGRLLSAPFIAGARRPGGPDVALSGNEIRQVANAISSGVETVRSGVLRDAAGEAVGGSLRTGSDGITRRLGMKIRLRDGLSEQQTASILAHELGHVIDDAAGGNVRLGSRTIKMDRLGIRRELRDLSSRLRPDIWMNPKRKAYRESWPELMADGISFYMRYPAEAKRRAPKFAKFLRLIVNEDERLSKTIQFNELAAVLGAGTGVAGAAALSGGLLSEPKPRPMAKSGLLDYRGGL